MTDEQDIRPGEKAVTPPEPSDAGLVFIGVIHTPWTARGETPRQGSADGPLCRIDVSEPWHEALEGIEDYQQLEVLYWLHQSRRDLVRQAPARHDRIKGTFALRSPIRPNPIGTSIVTLERREGATLFVRGLDCLDGTPLLDLKPARRPG